MDRNPSSVFFAPLPRVCLLLNLVYATRLTGARSGLRLDHAVSNVISLRERKICRGPKMVLRPTFRQ